MLANPTYKQLEASLRIGALTIGQWAQLLIFAVLALVFAVYVSPLPTGLTVFVSVIFAGSPVALSFGAMAQEWSVVEAIRAQWRWVSSPRKYLPGPGASATGYSIAPDRRPPVTDEPVASHALTDNDRGELWDL